MAYPKLVRHAKTPAHVVIEGKELNERGLRTVALDATLLCNYQSKSRQRITADKRIIETVGTAFFDGDILPEQATLASGKVTIYGVTHDIFRGSKERNPDGSVNFSRLELM